MRKIILSFLFVLFFIPLNAQRVIRYITFYPVPYGSHQNLNVSDTTILNASNGGKTIVSGGLSVSSAPNFEGSAFITVEGNDMAVQTLGTIRSGDSEDVSLGIANITGPNTIVQELDNSLSYAYIANTSELGADTRYGSVSFSALPNCGYANPSWKALRLKGSEECKYYLTCGGEGDSGCDEAPDLPECEFGPWIRAESKVIDTCGGARIHGCIQTTDCGDPDKPCLKLREAVAAYIPTTFNCGAGRQPDIYCYEDSVNCTQNNVSSFCRNHNGPEYINIDGLIYAPEMCSVSTLSDATFWCRNNPAKAGCILCNRGSCSYAGTMACVNSYTINSPSSASCNNAVVNVEGFVCQEGEDQPTTYYRICGG